MMNIIVAFPKIENAKSIKSILVRGGYTVNAVCTSGSHVLQYAGDLGDGIVICASHLTDMMYQELYQDLPAHMEMLLVASQNICEQKEASDIMCLSMPLKVYELLRTVEMMEYNIDRRRRKRRAVPKQRSEEEKALIQKAKLLLMERNSMTEEEAHRYIQKSSMDNGTGLTEVAQMILSMM